MFGNYGIERDSAAAKYRRIEARRAGIETDSRRSDTAAQRLDKRNKPQRQPRQHGES